MRRSCLQGRDTMLFLVEVMCVCAWGLLAQFEGAQVQCQSASGSHTLRFVHARAVVKTPKTCKLVSLTKRVHSARGCSQWVIQGLNVANEASIVCQIGSITYAKNHSVCYTRVCMSMQIHSREERHHSGTCY